MAEGIFFSVSVSLQGLKAANSNDSANNNDGLHILSIYQIKSWPEPFPLPFHKDLVIPRCTDAETVVWGGKVPV
jgi:hypothetical protein